MKPGNPPRPNSPEVLARLSPARLQLLKRRLQKTSAKIAPRSGNEAPPLSFAQQQLWFLDRLYPGVTIYNVTRAFRLTGMLQEKVLQQAFDTLVERHETLRTSFATSHGQPVQIIAPEMKLPVPVIDLDPGTKQQINQQIDQQTKKAEQEPIDLARGPLIRVKLLRIEPDQHVLVLVIHHTITDGLSLNLIIQELAALYAAYSNGQASPLAPLPLQYADYAAWQHQSMQAGKFDKQIAYWRSKLKNASMLELPGNRSHPSEQNFHGAKRTLKLPAGLGEKLKALSLSANVSLFMTFLGAFQALLHRYRGQEDIVIATPISGRTRPELDSLLGYFVNTLVLRTDLGGNPTFIELLGRVRETALDAFEHQDLTFAKLVEKLQVERQAARNPFFNVMINFREGLDQWTDFADIDVSQEEPRVTVCTFPLALYISPSSKGFELRMDYQTAFFDAGRVDSILRQYSYFLQQLVVNPEQPILSYSLIDAESRKLLPDPSRVLEAPVQPTVTALFAENVEQYPKREAVSHGKRHWSYSQLDQASNELAQILHQLGIARGDAVAITGERSFGQIVAILGILKCGGVMLPVDSGLPVKRRTTMLQIAQARQQIVITNDRVVNKSTVRHIPVLQLDADTGLAAVISPVHRDEWAELPTPQPDDPAYIFFTSGTTGTPKGILGSHKGLGHFISWQRTQFADGTYDRVAQLSSLSFDGGLRNIFLPLSSAGVLCLPLAKEESDVLPWLKRQGITFTHTVPSVAQSWLFNAPNGILLPAMRLLSFGGEALTDTVVRAWRTRLKDDCTIVNQYGPTETTLAKCFHILDGPLQPGTQSIGRALPQAQALILNRDGTLAGVGEEGEIVLRTPFGTLGYLAASGDSASGFKVNPFRNDTQDIVYYTGDRGCYQPDGTLDFLGRWDEQVKIHGVRIELEEIRALLKGLPGVEDAVILVHEEHPGDKRLAAYVVLDRDDPPTTETLRLALAEHLPNTMIPGIFIPLAAMPLTPGGKLDRKALPAPELNRSMLSSEYVPPNTSVEKYLVDLWQEVLKLDVAPGIHDDFFTLGGHSLLAVHLVARIEETLNQTLSLQDFFTRPTVFEVAKELDSSGQALIQHQQKPVEKIEARSGSAAPPLSFSQQRLWFLDHLYPDSYIYNTMRVFRLSGALHKDALRRAFNTLAQRHATLRTSFATTLGQAVQIIAPEMELPVPVIDLDAGIDQHIEVQIQQHIKRSAQTLFDLAQGPLIRAKLLRIDPGQHVLILVLHHIITDGISQTLMMRELETLYSAYSSGQPSPLTPLPFQYADYAVWQHQQLQAGKFDEQLAYWQLQLKESPMLELPIDRPYPLKQNFQGARRSLKLPAELSKNLKALSQTTGVSLFMTFLGAFQTLLHRYRDQEDIVIATPIAGRTRPEHEGLLGFFVNTLVLRTDLSGNPTFIELLGRVREMALSAYAHQELPFEKLVEKLQPERDIGRTPFFNVMINFHEDQDQKRTRFADLGIRPEDTGMTTSKFPLALGIIPSLEGIMLSMVYQTDLFDAEHIDCMLRQYGYLLEQIVVAPDQPVQSYSLVDTESRKLLPDPARSLEEPTQQLVTVAFTNCVRQHPEREAVSQGELSWTYRELDRTSDSIAQLLHCQGIDKGDVVAVTGERSFGLIAAMLGILKSGNVMLPVDAKLPAKRRATMLKIAHARMQIVVGNAQDESNLAGVDFPNLELESATGEVTTKPPDHSEGRVDLPVPEPDDPAYIFFTSGSTGKPKGILGSHKGLGHYISWQQNQFNIGKDDRVAQLSSISFDAALFDIFLPLTSASVLCLPSHKEEAEVVRWLQRQAITAMAVVPSVAQSWLLDLPEDVSLPALRLISFGGEALADTVVEEWRTRVPGSCTIVNQYGPTEATVAKCFHIVGKQIPPGIQPIGQAYPQTQSLILNKDGALAGIGEAGEIVIRSPFNTLGYLAASEEADSGFRTSPFRDDVQETIYYTGDKGCYRPDGALDFLGRLDDQVKIHGVRMELEEIRIVLAKHPGIKEAAILVREDQGGDKRLVAYIVLEKTDPPTTRALRRALAERLPNAMIPGIFVPLDALPLTSSGKLDRKALPIPELQHLMQDSEYALPRTTVEKTLVKLWQKLLSLDTPPGIHDDFFALGGHSLLAVQMVTRIEESLKLVIPLQFFYIHPTIAEVAGELEQSGPLSMQPQQKHGITAVREPERKAPPLSFAQQRLWFLDRLYPDVSTYNIRLALRLSGTLHKKALQRAFNTLVQRHETLRTSFAAPHGIAVQIIAPEMELPLPVIELDVEAMDEQIKQHVQEAAETTFDLEKGPLIHVKLLCLDPGQHVLILVIHHIITDGLSMDLMMQELEKLYTAYSTGQPSPLPPLPFRYADYSLWQHRKIQSGDLDEQLSYWRKKLNDSPMLKLPFDRLQLQEQNFHGAQQSLKLTPGLSKKLKALSQTTGVSLFMTLLGAFKTLLHRYRGQEDIVIATPIAGRTRPEHEGLLGLFVNTLVLRTDLSGNPPFIDLLGRIREMALDAYAHQDLPFEKLVETLQPERHASRTPFFNVMINFREGRDQKNARFADLDRRREASSATISKFPLELYISPSQEGIQLSFVYQTELFDASHIDCMLRQYGYLLEQIVAAPDLSIQSFSLVDAKSCELLPDPEHILEEPPQQPVTIMFEACAAKYSKRAAVSQGEQFWSYAELDHTSELIAQLIHCRGIAKGEAVAVTGKRSFGLIAAMLGILRSGGVMLPVDPDLPAKRRATMLKTGQASMQIVVGNALEESQKTSENIPVLALAADTGRPTIEAATDKDTWIDLTIPGPDDPAYIFFTSGTSGTPKGILGSHKGLGHFISWQQKQFDVGVDDRIAQLTNISFDVVLRDIFLPLTSGAVLCLPLEDEESNILRWLQQRAITIMHTVPSVAQSWLLDAPKQASLAGLRLLFFAGEALTDTAVKDWRALLPDRCSIVNLYGPTETTMAKCFQVIKGQPLPGFQAIGRPLPQTQALILNRGGALAGVGETGEIVLCSPFGTLGYLVDTEIEQSGFQVNPFHDDPQNRVYYTGDRGSYRPDGMLDFLGRWDNQVKIHGVRIELEEIRFILNQHPKIKQAAVLVSEDHTREKRLVAYIVLEDSNLPTTESLRRALSEHLPRAMIPELFMPIDAMPLTPSGKLNRKALPAPELDRSILDSEYTAPGTAIEETLANIWQEVLMLDSLPGIHDDFFSLGGHSLLSAHLVTRIEETLGQAMPLQYFFTHPTIAELAKKLDKTKTRPIAKEPQPASPAAGPWQLVPGLYDKLLSYVGSWRGERATPDSLVIGHNTGGTKPPLFWVLQSQYELSQLAAYLDEDQPVYGMRSGSAMMSYAELNIQTLALGYVEEIIALQPTGPLLLGGNCQGGRIALAIAQHLLRRQHEVSSLILMEWNYRPQSYGGPVTLLFGRDSHANPYSRFRYPELTWSRAFSDYEVEIISGSHSQFFDEPNIQSLVTALEQQIARALKKPLYLLPKGAKQVKLRVIDPPEALPAGSHYVLQVEVQNASTVAWARGEDNGLTLGNEWYTPEGQIVSQLDGRVPLPALLPGETGKIELPVVAPSQPGQIDLLIELIQEGVRQYEGEAGTIRLALNLVDQPLPKSSL